jgi:hypothetical protein
VQFHTGFVIAVPVLVAVVPITGGPLANHLVAFVLVETARAANIFAADLAAHPRDRLGDAKLVGRAAQAGSPARGPGIRRAERRARKRYRRNRK